MALQDISNPIVFLGGYITRFTAQLGLNSSPTTVDVEVVPGSVSNSYDVSHLATGFDFVNAEPGKMSGFQFGAFQFIGVIKSWGENYGPGGLTYNVKLVDPRFMFDGVHLAIGPGVICPSYNYPNLLNVFGYYGSPSGGGVTPDGTLFYKIRDYLNSTGTINVYGKRLSFILGSGFATSTGTLNPDGITSWYQIKSKEISLSQLLDQVSNDQGADYYAAIQYSGFNPSLSVVSPLNITTIKRSSATGTNEISGYINNWVNSGILMQYRRGRELRSGAGGAGGGGNTSILAGPPATIWFGCNTGDIYNYWGRDNEGAAIFNTSVPDSGLIRLDIPGNATITSILSDAAFRISYNKFTTTKTSTDIYPPKLVTSNVTATVTGYYAHELTMRAALYSQEAWESILYQYQPTIANKIGILFPPFLDRTTYINSPQQVVHASLGTVIASGREDLPAEYLVLIKSIYEITRNAASEFYGKQYICTTDNNYSVFISNWLGAGTFGFENGYPAIEYDVADSAWSQTGNPGIPSGVNNHETLHSTDNPAFKTEEGNLRAFFSYRHYNNTSNSSFPYAIDMRKLSDSDYFIEQGNKLCVPVTASLYEKYPTYMIFNVETDIYGITGGAYASSGYAEFGAFYDFLAAVGFSQNDINNNAFMVFNGENAKYGLAPPRPMAMASAGDNYGLFVPMERKICSYGPWVASGLRHGPLNFSTETDLNPTRFNGYSNLNSAGELSVNKTFSPLDVVDSAELTLAGLPIYNLGTELGDNAYITSMSIQFGQDGLSTNYELRTFALPNVRNSKLLNDRYYKVLNATKYNQKNIDDVYDEIARLKREKENKNSRKKINKPSDVVDAYNNSLSSQQDTSYIMKIFGG